MQAKNLYQTAKDIVNSYEHAKLIRMKFKWLNDHHKEKLTALYMQEKMITDLKGSPFNMQYEVISESPLLKDLAAALLNYMKSDDVSERIDLSFDFRTLLIEGAIAYCEKELEELIYNIVNEYIESLEDEIPDNTILLQEDEAQRANDINLTLRRA